MYRSAALTNMLRIIQQREHANLKEEIKQSTRRLLVLNRGGDTKPEKDHLNKYIQARYIRYLELYHICTLKILLCREDGQLDGLQKASDCIMV